MTRTLLARLAAIAAAAWAPAACANSEADSAAPLPQERASPRAAYLEMVELFEGWREFVRPAYVGGVPDYSAGAMAAQHALLPQWFARLDAIDTTRWSVSRRIDWHLVRAEMNGLDFEHRVRRPWARDPAFYASVRRTQSDVPAHVGPAIDASIDLWRYDHPLSAGDAAELANGIGAIPNLLDRAMDNLTGGLAGDARDLWLAGAGSFRAQEDDLAELAETVAGAHPALDTAIADARAATAEFRDWIVRLAPGRTGASGIGADNYTWYMRNVHLVPYTWEEQVTLMRRELARAHSALRIEEHRNRSLPEQTRIASAQEYDRRLNEAVTEYMRFLEEEDIQTVYPWMEPALRAKNGSFAPADPERRRDLLSEVGYRDPLVARTHKHHWIELETMAEAPHPSAIRRTPLLFNIWGARAEGLATGMEEMMMRAGLFADSPRSRELVWILVAQRAAQALGGLYLQGNVFDLDEAVEHAAEWAPREWMPDADLARGEQQLYLRQPGYGVSHLTGKMQIEDLMSEWALQEESRFTLARFFNGFYGTGMIPVVLARWEMTGQIDPILDPRS